MIPVATAAFSELNITGKSRHGGIDSIAVHCHLTPSLRSDPSLPAVQNYHDGVQVGKLKQM